MAQGKVIFRYSDIQTAVAEVNRIAENFQTAGATFNNSINTAIENWSGDSKNNFKTLIDGDVKKFLETDVFNIVTAIAKLLDDNAEAMSQTDMQVAKGIPSSFR